MGKRELLIAVAFVAIGVLVYQVAATPAKPGQGFSFSEFFRNARRQLQANNASASTVITGTVAASAALKTVRLTGVTGDVHVVGEARTDVKYELTVQSTGPDEATALDYAKQSKVNVDDLGDSIGLRVTYPTPGRQTSEIVLRVPARLAVRLDSTSGADVKGVGAVQFDPVVAGDVTVADIAGSVTGRHRDGELTVKNAATVKLVVQRSRCVFESIAHDLMLDIRDGTCQIGGGAGPIEIDEQRTELKIDRPGGPLRISGSDGRLQLTEPGGEVSVDVRRMPVDISMRTGVMMTVLTTADPLRVYLDGPPAIAVDARATSGGTIDTDFGLQPEIADQEKRLQHTFGDGTPARVTLRNNSGAIAIRKGAMPATTSRNPK